MIKISKVEITGFRLLKNFKLDLEKDFSVIVGKNNTGKTSLMTLFKKCFVDKSFSFDDFNLALRDEILNLLVKTDLSAEEFSEKKIMLNLYISYEKGDSLKNLEKIILDLDPEIKTALLSFEYVLTYDRCKAMIEDFKVYKTKETNTKYSFLKNNYKSYFIFRRRALIMPGKDQTLDIDDKDIKKIINIDFIDANRDVDNKDNSKGKALSALACKYFEAKNGNNELEALEKLKGQVITANEEFSTVYDSFFQPIIEMFKNFVATKTPTKIKVLSELDVSGLIKNSASVKYEDSNQMLPESHNGLGYMNLLMILLSIYIKLDNFKKTDKENEAPSDINLLFIEEPEAHTHPQMQYIFMKNIKRMLKENGKDINIQTVLTTHSAHIVAQADFSDIKYFYVEDNYVSVKNLNELESEYNKADKDNGKANFDFLKKYMTLNSAELFFADKAIFIEGDSERILFPAFMKKVDSNNQENKLLSQNVSLLEVGNYSQVFIPFLDFLNIKTLIITDIDSVNESGEACPVSDGVTTSNSSVKYFLGKENCLLEKLKSLKSKDKVFSLEEGKPIPNPDGKYMVSFQEEEDSYYARSFEDAFIAKNRKFIDDNKDKFISLKNKKDFGDNKNSPYNLANHCICKKTTFATDILFFSKDEYPDWDIPSYIKEGLEWLAQ